MTPWMQFLDKKIGKAETDRILDDLKMDRLKILDPNGFISQEENHAFVSEVIRVTGDQDIGYQMGRGIEETLSGIQGFIIGATSPAFLMKNLGKIEEKLALKTINKTLKIGENRFKVDITFRQGFKEKQYVCRNRIGMYEALPTLFGLPLARVDHSQCAFQGADHCSYTIYFPEDKFKILSRLFQISLFLSLIFLGFWLRDISHALFLNLAMGTLSMGLLSFAIYRGQSAKKSLDWSMLTNEGLAKQNKTLENTNVQFHSLQDLTIALNNTTHVQDLCKKIVSMMVNDFHYGSSQIWLLDEKSEYLTCKSALGYSEDLLAFITNTSFKMGENWDNPYGLLVQTLEQKKTLLINDPEEVYARVTSRTRDFLKALNISSFIMTPLIHENKPLGILAAEYHKGEKLQNQDKLLFQSVSNSVANALVKAELFEQMEDKIILRTRELEITSQKLLAAQEMAIQSEKLSSLGQMAAGVAHEINNPLNFLVNILPEVRRDIEGLEKIRDLAIKANLQGNLADTFKQVEDQYDLESHLEEKEFVFSKIQKALDKSTRIANSLKVFSRTSAKEKIEFESFAGMIKDVIELLPQTVVGNTEIIVDIPADLGVTSNKNELEQAFLAIINNAIDAMEQKGKIEILGQGLPNEIILSFQDFGPGLSESALKKIFDPFYTTKPPGKGTGLGLTIASEIVKKYGGNISVESKVGEGAKFILKFKK